MRHILTCDRRLAEVSVIFNLFRSMPQIHSFLFFLLYCNGHVEIACRLETDAKIHHRKHRRRFILLLFVPDNENEHFVRISSKNVPPKDTKPLFLINYPPKKPFSRENLPLEWQELIIHFSSICLYIYTPVICAGTNN